MSKKALIVVVVIVAALIIGGYKFYTTQLSGISGLKVITTPAANVFLDDKSIGKTPYDDKQPPGEYILKLIPEEGSRITWQGKIVLQPKLLTFVKRDLGTSELVSGGAIVSMETISGSEAQVAVFSKPDASTLIFDGQEKGTTPYLIRDVVPGEHDVAVSSPGFIGRTVRVLAQAGYKISVDFQLAVSESSESSPSASPSGTTTDASSKEPAKPYAVIKDTPTGFLRVRNDAGTSSDELAQVKPGEKYSILEEKNDWYKIAYEQNKEGWISSRYAEKVE